MASEYTGVPTADQSPSPAPSLGDTAGGDPIGNLPTDGDTLNVSSVNQAFKVPLDWIAFLRRWGYTFKGIRTWSSSVTYAAGDIVWYSSNGYCYIASQAGTNQNPSTETDYWDRWGHTEAQAEEIADTQIAAYAQTYNLGLDIDMVTGGIATTHGTLVTGSVVNLTHGNAAETRIRDLAFQLAFSTDGEATVSFSGDKAFATGKIRNVVVTSISGVTVYGIVNPAYDTLSIGASGMGGGGATVNVRVLGEID
jgi:hypothetical protein